MFVSKELMTFKQLINQMSDTFKTVVKHLIFSDGMQQRDSATLVEIQSRCMASDGVVYALISFTDFGLIDDEEYLNKAMQKEWTSKQKEIQVKVNKFKL